MRRLSGLQHHRARARHGVPLSADRRPGDLFVQCLAAGRGLGRLVDALVRRAARRRAAASSPRWSACASRSLRRRRRPCSARSRRWRWCGSAVSAAGSFRRDDLCAAGDAGSDHRLVAAAAVRRRRRRPRLLDGRDRPHHPGDVLRRRDRAVAPCRFRHGASRRRRWISAPRRSAPSCR